MGNEVHEDENVSGSDSVEAAVPTEVEPSTTEPEIDDLRLSLETARAEAATLSAAVKQLQVENNALKSANFASVMGSGPKEYSAPGPSEECPSFQSIEDWLYAKDE